MSLWSKFFGDEPTHTTESPDEIQQNIDSGKAIMLDVRSQEEWDNGFLHGVTLIQITELKMLPEGTTEVEGLDKTKIIYCH